ncbi:MAG: hypothetical protein JWQ17_5757, partial [Tardiphaga sp.]|nr:hypothetical protein [Tardiphaga sp.]
RATRWLAMTALVTLIEFEIIQL